jgi:predicted Zn finger-like uncharacterized protein
MITFTCPGCSTPYRVHANKAGKKTACPKCGRRFSVPCLTPTKSAASIQERDWRTVPPPVRGAGNADTATTEEPLDVIPVLPAASGPEAAAVLPSCPTPQAVSKLTGCFACGREIAKEAATCPGCGAPNRYLHPEILRFQSGLSRFHHLNRFQHQARADVLAGWSEEVQGVLAGMASHWINSLGFTSLGGGLSGAGQLARASLIQGSAVGILDHFRAKGTKAFVVNFGFDPPIWQSTDDAYWGDVVDFFGLSHAVSKSSGRGE